VRRHWTAELEDAAASATASLGMDNDSPLRFCCGLGGELDYLIDRGDSASKHVKSVRKKFLKAVLEITRPHQDYEIWERPELAFSNLYQGKAGILYTALRLIDRNLPSLSGFSEAPRW